MSSSSSRPAPWPNYSEEEVGAVSRVLRSGKVNYWTGTEGRRFESEFADAVGVNRAVFVANGTVALELAIRALDLPPNSEVITTPRTFIASASAIVSAGHRPVFADVDPDSGNITPTSIACVITSHTAAVLVVHLGGWPAEMVGIRALCDSRGLYLIEDCAQAHGAMIGEAHVGSFGDVSAWSFCQDKIITTGGEGGMVATNDDRLWRWMWAFKDHGKSWASVYERDHPPGFRWLHESFGTNWRGTEMQAAIGRIQYKRLAEWHAARSANALELQRHLKAVPGLRVPVPEPGVAHAYYRLYAYIGLERLAPGWSRDRIVAEVVERGQQVFAGSCSELYLERAFTGTGSVPSGPLPVARRLSWESMAFLVHPGLTAIDMTWVAEAVGEVMLQATQVAVESGRGTPNVV